MGLCAACDETSVGGREVSAERPRPLLELHVVHHPMCREGEELGERLFRTFFEAPTDLPAHGLRIPIRMWTGDGDGAAAGPPAWLDLDSAEQAVVVVLVDDHFL